MKGFLVKMSLWLLTEPWKAAEPGCEGIVGEAAKSSALGVGVALHLDQGSAS